MKIFRELCGVGAERMYCVQDYQDRGLFDVTLDSEGLCLQVFEAYKEKKEDVRLQGVTMEPLFSNDVKVGHSAPLQPLCYHTRGGGIPGPVLYDPQTGGEGKERLWHLEW